MVMFHSFLYVYQRVATLFDLTIDDGTWILHHPEIPHANLGAGEFTYNI